MANPEQQELARELIAALRDGVFIRNATATDRVNNFAERAKQKLDDVLALMDNRGPQFWNTSIETIEDLIALLESTMAQRRNARVGGAVGNVGRIGGTLFYASPIGQTVFWTGFAISTACDLIAQNRSTNIDELIRRIRRLLQNDSEEFRLLAGAIRQLEETIQEATGWSIYDAEFQEFLRAAAENPRNVEATIPAAVTEDVRCNIIEIARNRNLISLLQRVYDGIRNENLVVLQVLVQAFNAVSFLEGSAVHSAAFQFGELAVRGLQIFVEYKKNKAHLQEFKDGVSRMRMELRALEEILNAGGQ